MHQKLSQVFKKISEIEPNSGLEALVMQKIGLQQAKIARRNLIFSYLGLAGSGLAIFGSVFSFGGAFLESEFWNLSALLFSDLMIVTGNWKDFMYSLLETFPVINMIVILIPIFTLLLSFNAYLNNRRSNFKLNFS